ncbi:MAG: hypothetical protein KDD34_05785 [Bdellovibrionales bacterium]|nr:hypothetical protein [Bdellovibrionales bacterium]
MEYKCLRTPFTFISQLLMTLSLGLSSSISTPTLAFEIGHPRHEPIRRFILEYTTLDTTENETLLRIHNFNENQFVAIVWDPEQLENAKVYHFIFHGEDLTLIQTVKMTFSLHGPHLDPLLSSYFTSLMRPILFDQQTPSLELKLSQFLRQQSKSAVLLKTGRPISPELYQSPCLKVLK